MLPVSHRRKGAAAIDPLDGFPVAAIMSEWPARSIGANELLSRLAGYWLDDVDRELKQLPTGGVDFVESVEARLQQTRSALHGLAASSQHAPAVTSSMADQLEMVA